ncbi:MAG: hypothetical protein HY071_01045 [Chloroflexi bacterium]|nr:hypothetical protein [Chloroflexota bacterium]
MKLRSRLVTLFLTALLLALVLPTHARADSQAGPERAGVELVDSDPDDGGGDPGQP